MVSKPSLRQKSGFTQDPDSIRRIFFKSAGIFSCKVKKINFVVKRSLYGPYDPYSVRITAARKNIYIG
jgi:hypothetical protein